MGPLASEMHPVSGYYRTGAECQEIGQAWPLQESLAGGRPEVRVLVSEGRVNWLGGKLSLLP